MARLPQLLGKAKCHRSGQGWLDTLRQLAAFGEAIEKRLRILFEMRKRRLDLPPQTRAASSELRFASPSPRVG